MKHNETRLKTGQILFSTGQNLTQEISIMKMELL